MAKISRPIILLPLSLIFLLAGALGGPANGLDLMLSSQSATLRASLPAFTRFTASFTDIGAAIVTLAVTAIAALILLARRRASTALLLVGTVLIERLLVEGLKGWVERPRPALEPLMHLPESLAYPSGHAANSMTAFLAVALFVSPAPFRRAGAVAALILSFLIGCSRVYLGVHWATDVIGGWTFGLLNVGLAVRLGQWSAALPLEAKHEIVGRHRHPADEIKST